MNMMKKLAAALLMTFGINAAANAITVTFNFTGECDDCAFQGNPGDAGFDPLNDGLTETVSATLTIVGLDVDANGFIDDRGTGFSSFAYHGSSLINPFVMSDPYLFTNGLMTDGSVADGEEFVYGSTQNYADPANPVSFNFPNFCTPLGEQVLRFGSCDFVGDVRFRLDSIGNWSISSDAPSDVGIGGQFTAAVVPIPAAAWLFASGLFGLIGLARRS